MKEKIKCGTSVVRSIISFGFEIILRKTEATCIRFQPFHCGHQYIHVNEFSIKVSSLGIGISTTLLLRRKCVAEPDLNHC